MKNYRFTTALPSVFALLLMTACGPSSQMELQAQATANALEPRYQASLSEGITFSTPGYPNFISAVKGISITENFGRWTDGNEAALEFFQPLPKKFTLKITASVYLPSMGKPIKVVIGGKKYDAEFPHQWDFKEVAIPVSTDGTVKSISFELPNAKAPQLVGQSVDGRKLCLALSSIKIVEQ